MTLGDFRARVLAYCAVEGQQFVSSVGGVNSIVSERLRSFTAETCCLSSDRIAFWPVPSRSEYPFWTEGRHFSLDSSEVALAHVRQVCVTGDPLRDLDYQYGPVSRQRLSEAYGNYVEYDGAPVHWYVNLPGSVVLYPAPTADSLGTGTVYRLWVPVSPTTSFTLALDQGTTGSILHSTTGATMASNIESAVSALSGQGSASCSDTVCSDVGGNLMTLTLETESAVACSRTDIEIAFREKARVNASYLHPVIASGASDSTVLSIPDGLCDLAARFVAVGLMQPYATGKSLERAMLMADRCAAEMARLRVRNWSAEEPGFVRGKGSAYTGLVELS